VKDPARCQRLAEQFGITALLNRRFKYLSTGETRKTLLCQALMSEPELLILDEPFDGLDVQSRRSWRPCWSRLISRDIPWCWCLTALMKFRTLSSTRAYWPTVT
jgi:ABC-type molybdenum transport system ATPase subunit/photorepair protein PhrA